MTDKLTDEQLREWRTWLAGLMRWPPCNPQMIIALIEEVQVLRAADYASLRDHARIRNAALDEAAELVERMYPEADDLKDAVLALKTPEREDGGDT
jgi:hypothetical protein